nr:MFS transporter [Streptomyces europaeiscabiei]
MSSSAPVESSKASASAESSKAPKAAAASLIGTTIEYYDFAVHGTASALVLGPAFLPSGNATVSSLAAFLTFAAAFLSRPLGVVRFGTIGDRPGRRQGLVASLPLLGIATVGVGLLPTYESAGLLVPALLVTLRLLQGVGMDVEWGGAVLPAAEHAPPGRRALYAAVPDIGPSLGFLLSAVLVLVGLWVRTTVSESPVFKG